MDGGCLHEDVDEGGSGGRADPVRVAGLPPPHVILGLCGIVLILVCTSLYILAVRGKRLERFRGSLSEENMAETS